MQRQVSPWQEADQVNNAQVSIWQEADQVNKAQVSTWQEADQMNKAKVSPWQEAGQVNTVQRNISAWQEDDQGNEVKDSTWKEADQAIRLQRQVSSWQKSRERKKMQRQVSSCSSDRSGQARQSSSAESPVADQLDGLDLTVRNDSLPPPPPAWCQAAAGAVAFSSQLQAEGEQMTMEGRNQLVKDQLPAVLQASIRSWHGGGMMGGGCYDYLLNKVDERADPHIAGWISSGQPDSAKRIRQRKCLEAREPDARNLVRSLEGQERGQAPELKDRGPVNRRRGAEARGQERQMESRGQERRPETRGQERTTEANRIGRAAEIRGEEIGSEHMGKERGPEALGVERCPEYRGQKKGSEDIRLGRRILEDKSFNMNEGDQQPRLPLGSRADYLFKTGQHLREAIFELYKISSLNYIQ